MSEHQTAHRDEYCKRKRKYFYNLKALGLLNRQNIKSLLTLYVLDWIFIPDKKAIDLFRFHVNLHFKSSYIRICPKSSLLCMSVGGEI